MAQDINKFIVVGRLTRDLGSDPNGRDFTYLQNGTCKGTISIASNRSKKQGDQWIEEVSYFNIEIWGKMAENLRPYLTKGKQVCCECYLKQDRWKDQNGANQSRITIVAESIQLFGGNQNQQNTPQYEQVQQNPFAQNQSTYAQQYARQNQPQNQQNGFVQEDLPYANGNDYPQDIPF